MLAASLLTRIHATPVMAVIVVTGGGVQAVADLLSVPGASRTVLEVLVPYCRQSLLSFLGAVPLQAVSVETAAALAVAAYRRAVQLREQETVPVIGLACTATLVTDRPKKGMHRAHVGLKTMTATRVYSLTLQKGARDRAGEERVVSNLVLQVLAEACAADSGVEIGLLPSEQVTVHELP
ncbi:MAG: hypothetical protein NZ578_03640 [Candidatus Binatia bacterium]|nr:hypothetical protein [Candidatus Binatia bacterium]